MKSEKSLSDTTAPRTVLIDGVEYFARTPAEQAAMKALEEAYGILWVEAYYDPESSATKKFAASVAPLLKLANDSLRFKK